MFEHFTFGAIPQARQQEDLLSPMDLSSLAPQNSTTLDTIWPITYDSKLSEQALLHKSRDELVKQFEAWQMDQEPGFPEVDESEMSEDTISMPPTPILSNPEISTSTSSTCRRLQRQLHVQLQTCSSHIKDISSLVDDMIASNSQCNFRRPIITMPPPKSSSQPGIKEGPDSLVVDTSNEFDDVGDEGFFEDRDDEMSLRRASTPMGVRKYGVGVRYGRSADVVTIGGKLKVKSLPRMRRRIKAARKD